MWSLQSLNYNRCEPQPDMQMFWCAPIVLYGLSFDSVAFIFTSVDSQHHITTTHALSYVQVNGMVQCDHMNHAVALCIVHCVFIIIICYIVSNRFDITLQSASFRFMSYKLIAKCLYDSSCSWWFVFDLQWCLCYCSYCCYCCWTRWLTPLGVHNLYNVFI